MGRLRFVVLMVALAAAMPAVTACRPTGRVTTAGSPVPASSSAPAALSPAASPSSPAPATSALPTGAPSPPAAAPDLLRPGAAGPEVLALQQRLAGLGYWLGTLDGRYGSATVHALTALQKVGGGGRDGVLGPETRRLLEHAARPHPRSTSGTLIEVDLSRQVVLLARDGRTEWVLDASTGAVAGTTPTGRFSIFRQVDGYDHGPLGVLYRPKYFVGGVAVHGYPDVPPYPASHGCVRVTNEAMDWLWSTGRIPVGLRVWVY